MKKVTGIALRTAVVTLILTGIIYPYVVTGLAQLWLYRRREPPPGAPYIFILIDSLALGAVLVMPNPFSAVQVPPALPFRYASFVYFFVLLMQTTFSFRPRLLLWTGLCGAGAWTLAFLWVKRQPGVVTETPFVTDLPTLLGT